MGVKEAGAHVKTKGPRPHRSFGKPCLKDIKDSRPIGFQLNQSFQSAGTSLALFHFHSGYSCSICGKQYRTREGLRLHIHTHQGRKFSCSICENKFTQKSSLRTHMKSIHQVVECLSCHSIFPHGPIYQQHLEMCFSNMHLTLDAEK